MPLTSFSDYGLRMLMRIAGEPSRAFSTAPLREMMAPRVGRLLNPRQQPDRFGARNARHHRLMVDIRGD